MASYKLLGGGGAIIRIFVSPNYWDGFMIQNSMGGTIIKEDVKITTEALEVKIPTDELIWYPDDNSYEIDIYMKKGTSYDDYVDYFLLGQIPLGGDGTWHYYTWTTI